MAAGLASLVALLGFLVCMWVVGVSTGATAASAASGVFGHLSLFVLVFAWPVLFAAIALVAVPGYQLLPSGWRRLAVFISAGVSVGAIAMPLCWRALWGSTDSVLLLMLIGGFCGAAGGSAFWLVAE